MNIFNVVKLTDNLTVPLIGPNCFILKKGTIGTIQANGFMKDSFMVEFNLSDIVFVIQVDAGKITTVR